MTSTIAYPAARTAPRFGRESAPQPENTPNASPASETAPNDQAAFSKKQTQPNLTYRSHVVHRYTFNIQSLHARIQKFLHQLSKAFKTLLGQGPVEHKEPVLNASLKRFKKAVRQLAQSPDLDKNIRPSVLKANEALLNSLQLSEEEKKTSMEDMAEALKSNSTKDVLPHAFANILDQASNIIESPETPKLFKETFTQLPDLLATSLEDLAKQEEKPDSLKMSEQKDKSTTDKMLGILREPALFTNMLEKSKKASAQEQPKSEEQEEDKKHKKAV